MEKFASLDRTIEFGNAFPVEGNGNSPVGALAKRAYGGIISEMPPGARESKLPGRRGFKPRLPGLCSEMPPGARE